MKKDEKKRMKGKAFYHLFYIGVLCMSLLCSGCAAGEGEGLTEDAGSRLDVSSAGSGTEDLENVSTSKIVSGADTESGGALSVELTAEERNVFTGFVNQVENNGFLLSQYETITGADLNEILYNGAGMESEPLSEEERKAYEKAGHSVETDLTRLTTEQIEAFLQRKAGVGMADMTGGLDWVYLEASDCYVFQHGDTNFCNFVCTGGTRTGEMYELHFKADSDYVSDCITVLRKNGDDYRFVSNRYQSISQAPGEIPEEELDLSGLDQETARQLKIFAETKEQWIPQDYDPFAFGVTAHDLDGDGRLELLVQVMAGTGLYSENHFYQVNDSGDGIEELPQELYDGVSELDIGVSGSGGQAFRDRDGVVYYMASDITRNGYAESFLQEGAYYLKDGRVYSVAYRGLHRQAQGEDSWEETCYDAEGNEVSQADWEGLREGFLAGKEEIPYTISWKDMYPEDAQKASVQEILRYLAEQCGKAAD